MRGMKVTNAVITLKSMIVEAADVCVYHGLPQSVWIYHIHLLLDRNCKVLIAHVRICSYLHNP